MFPSFNQITTDAAPLFSMVEPLLPWVFGIAIFWQTWRLVTALVRMRGKAAKTKYSYGEQSDPKK